MKKFLCLIIIILLLTICVACGGEKSGGNDINVSAPLQNGQESSTPIIHETHTFIGEVLSVEKGMILVSPDEQNSAISPEVFVNVSQFPKMSFQKGDRVKVVFNGQVAQSFPPQILGVINIEIIE